MRVSGEVNGCGCRGITDELCASTTSSWAKQLWSFFVSPRTPVLRVLRGEALSFLCQVDGRTLVQVESRFVPKCLTDLLGLDVFVASPSDPQPSESYRCRELGVA